MKNTKKATIPAPFPVNVSIKDDNSVAIEETVSAYEASVRAYATRRAGMTNTIGTLVNEIYGAANGERFMRLPSLKAQLLAKLINGNSSRASVESAEADIHSILPRFVVSEKGAGRGTRLASVDEVAMYDATGKHFPEVSTEVAQ